MIASAIARTLLLVALFVFVCEISSYTPRRLQDRDEDQYGGTTKCIRGLGCNCTQCEMDYAVGCLKTAHERTRDWVYKLTNEDLMCEEYGIRDLDRSSLEKSIRQTCEIPESAAHKCMDLMNEKLKWYLGEISFSIDPEVQKEREALLNATECIALAFNRCKQEPGKCFCGEGYYDEDEAYGM